MGEFCEYPTDKDTFSELTSIILIVALSLASKLVRGEIGAINVRLV